jgi:tetratricopeptide (TPR) repeat protein
MVGIVDREYFRARAVEMAHIQARYLLRSPTQLQPETALPQAVGLIRDCVRHLDQPALAIELALGFHPMVERWSTWPGWAEALDLVLALDRPYLMDTVRIRLLNCLSQAARALGDYTAAMRVATDALQLAEAQHDRMLIAESHNRIGMIALFRDDFITARAHFEQAYRYGIGHLPPLELGNISMNLGTIAMHQNEFLEAHQHFDEALRRYRAADEPVYIAKAQCNRAELLRREGRPGEVLPILLAARDVFRSAGARYEYGLVENDLGCVYLSLRQWEAALDALSAAITEFEQIGSLSGKAWVLPNIAELYVTTEQWAKAMPALDEARELALICGRQIVAAAVDVDQGRMLAARGDHVGARRVWEGALRVQEFNSAKLAAQHTRRLIEGLPPENCEPAET